MVHATKHGSQSSISWIHDGRRTNPCKLSSNNTHPALPFLPLPLAAVPVLGSSHWAQGRQRSLGSKATKGGCGISRKTSTRADPYQGRLRGGLRTNPAKRGNAEYSPTKRGLQRAEPRQERLPVARPGLGRLQGARPGREGCRKQNWRGKLRGLGADLSQGRLRGAQLGRGRLRGAQPAGSGCREHSRLDTRGAASGAAAPAAALLLIHFLAPATSCIAAAEAARAGAEGGGVGQLPPRPACLSP